VNANVLAESQRASTSVMSHILWSSLTNRHRKAGDRRHHGGVRRGPALQVFMSKRELHTYLEKRLPPRH
jgi:hypothetical protein